MAILRQVAKTDTFEKQRQTINLIGQDLFDQVGTGDTDLAAGNIKLGDGTKTAPSLAFTNQSTLGVYKPVNNTIGLVNTGGDIAYFADNISFYKPFLGVQKQLVTSGLTISAPGTNYDPGSYTDVAAIGGFGSDGSLDITVVGLSGPINDGSGFNAGTYENATFTGGNGSGVSVNFTVPSLGDVGTITDPGSGYTEGSYSSVNATTVSGNGTGATVDIVVNAGGEVESAIFLGQGQDYEFGSVLSVNAADVGGTGSGFEFTLGADPAVVTNLQYTSYGSGYQIGDVLTLPTTLSIPVTLGSTTVVSTTEIEGVLINQFVTGTGFQADTLVTSVDLENGTFEVDKQPTQTGSTTATFANIPYGGSGFSLTVDGIGVLETVAVNNAGNGYEPGDLLTFNPQDLIQPIEYTITVSTVQEVAFQGTSPTTSDLSVGDSVVSDDGVSGPFTIVKLDTSGSTITKMYVNVDTDPNGFQESSFLVVEGTTTPSFQVAVGAQPTNNRYFIDGAYAPSLTLYEGSLYRFDYSAAEANGHPWMISAVPDGIHNTVTGVTATLSNTAAVVTVNDSTGILPGMGLTITAGTGGVANTARVLSVDNATQVTLTENPTVAGTATITFAGVEFSAEYVDKQTGYTDIIPDSTTPTLYYNCLIHPGMGNGANSSFTIDPNNPKTFGSDGVVTVSANVETDIFKIDSFTGITNINTLTGTTATISNLNSTTANSATYTATAHVDTPKLQHTTALEIAAPATTFSGETTNFGPNIQFTNSLSKLELSSIVASDIIIDTFMNIDNNRIFTTSTNDLTLEAEGTGRIVKVDGTTAFAVPVGTTAERPVLPTVRLGAIRYNTDTQQYEGYLGATNWSSLGGVRDIDGNTKILAEEDTGVNDNKLWFYNDGALSARLTPDFLEFINTNSLRSIDPSTPEFKEWVPNDPVTTGEYVKYRNNLFQVTGANGVNGTLATPPENLSGTAFTHGTTEYTFIQVAVRDLILTESTAVKIGPNKDVPLVVSDETQILDNTISSLSLDLTIAPATDKKVVVDAVTSLVLPVGANGDRGIPAQGSVRYNTDITQFEGYNGGSWSSLGGVRDVDGDTLIKPESSAGADEDILYFINNNQDTLQITTTAFKFGQVDTIESATTNELNVSVPAVRFGGTNETAIDHNDNGNFTDRVYLNTSKANLELGVSAGLTNRPMFRITENGEFQSNATALLAAPTGDTPYWSTFTDIIGSQLRQRDFGFSSDRFELVRGTTDTFNVTLYDNQLVDSCVVEIQAHITDGSYEKEYIQFVVTDNKVDILYNEISSLQTGINLISNINFEFESPNNSGATLGNVRVTGALDSNISNGDAVRFVVLTRSLNNVAVI